VAYFEHQAAIERRHDSLAHSTGALLDTKSPLANAYWLTPGRLVWPTYDNS
jgi:hypothetical protein